MSSIFAFTAVPAPLAPGHSVGPYRIGAVLGEDLDGFTYTADELHSERRVLLREGCPVGLVQRVGTEVVPLEGAEADFSDWLARWKRLLTLWQQAERATDPARLGRSALVHIEDRGDAHGTAWVSLRPPGGRTLRQVAEDGPGWPDRAMADAGLHACCGAVEALHRLGGLHGSLTPERVQVLDGGAWCLLLPDTDPERQPLSPWLALEQTEAGRAAGLTPGPWTDVHGIAALAHWLLTGSAPPSIERRQADAPGCWTELERAERDPLRLRALRSALAPRPADRLGSVAALRMALGWSERHVPVTAETRSAPVTPAPAPVPPTPPAGRDRAGVVALVGLLVSLSAVFSVLWINRGSSVPVDEASATAAAPRPAPSTGSAAPRPPMPAPKVAARADGTAASAPRPRPPLAASVPAVGEAARKPVAAAAVKPREPEKDAAKTTAGTASGVAVAVPRAEPASRAVPVQTASAGRRKPSQECIDWLRRRSLEPAGTEHERNPACE